MMMIIKIIKTTKTRTIMGRTIIMTTVTKTLTIKNDNNEVNYKKL